MCMLAAAAAPAAAAAAPAAAAAAPAATAAAAAAAAAAAVSSSLLPTYRRASEDMGIMLALTPIRVQFISLMPYHAMMHLL